MRNGPRLEQMFEGGKGVYAEGFGTLDEHRVLPKRQSPCHGVPAAKAQGDAAKAQHSHGGSGS